MVRGHTYPFSFRSPGSAPAQKHLNLIDSPTPQVSPIKSAHYLPVDGSTSHHKKGGKSRPICNYLGHICGGGVVLCVVLHLSPFPIFDIISLSYVIENDSRSVAFD